jgi:succinate dehydrogenase / fumarate reductase cytochrome b subunit
MSHSAPQNERPLSPHLQVYKPQMTSVLSITHRATGVALIVGTIFLGAIVIAAAMGEANYDMIMGYANTLVGKIILLGWTWSLYYHLCNGIRHLFWDMGYLFKIQNANRAGYVVLLSSVILTAGTWYLAMHAACGGAH